MTIVVIVSVVLAAASLRRGARAYRGAAVRERLGAVSHERSIHVPDATQLAVSVMAIVVGWLALRYAAAEADTPVRQGLERLVADLDVGVPIEQALELWRVASPGPDTDLVVGALELHRRSGGDLPAVLDQVTTSIRERVSVAREVRSLTAQARLSAWILGLLPVGFFAFLWLTARENVQGALATSIGIACLAVGLLLEGGAVLWIRSLIRVT
jgi:tight adherence protein B